MADPPDAALSSDLVTAVVTTRDRPDFLRRAIESVGAQTYRPLDLIVVDDGSPDPVRLDALPIPPDLPATVLRSDRATGIAAARNRGVRAAAGRFVAFLDDDDRWEPGKTAAQVARLLDEPPARACGCRIVVEDAEGRILATPDAGKSRQQIIDRLVYSDENLTPSTLMFDREAFLALGGFREDMPAAEDREFLVRFLLAHPVAVLPDRLVRFTEHRGVRLTRNAEAMFEGERLYLAFIQGHADALGLRHRPALGYRHAKLAHQAMLAGRQGTALRHFATALALYPIDKRVAGGALLSLLGPTLYHRLIALRIARLR